MAERRMFAKAIVDSDAFLDMPLSAQALYFHLSMRADDEGFVGNPKKIQRMIGASDDDFRLLVAKRFLLTFESGVVVIKHWKIHNYIQADRFRPTTYCEEKATLSLDQKKAYIEAGKYVYPNCIQTVSNLDAQYSIGKDSVVEDRLIHSERNAHVCAREGLGPHGCVFLTDEEIEELYTRIGTIVVKQYIKRLDQFIFEKGATVADHFNTILKWWEEDKG